MTPERAAALGLAGATALGLAVVAGTRASSGRPSVLAVGAVAALAIVIGGGARHRLGPAIAFGGVALLATVAAVGEVVTPSAWGSVAEATALFLVAETTAWAAERATPMARPVRIEPDRAMAIVGVAAGGALAGALILANAAYVGAIPRLAGLFLAGGATMALALVLVRMAITIDRPAPGRGHAPAPPS